MEVRQPDLEDMLVPEDNFIELEAEMAREEMEMLEVEQGDREKSQRKRKMSSKWGTWAKAKQMKKIDWLSYDGPPTKPMGNLSLQQRRKRKAEVREKGRKDLE